MIPEVRTMVGGARIGHLALATAAFSIANNADLVVNTTMGDDTPSGLLAGHMVISSASGEVGVAAAGEAAFGINLFNVNNHEVVGYENNFTAASENITFFTGVGAHCSVNVYETKTAASRTTTGDVPVAPAYAAGLPLYVSANGLLTTEDESTGVIVATVVAVGGDFMEIRLEV